MPGMQHEHHPWQKLHQADQAQVEHAAGEFVDMPADGDCDHLETACRADAGEPESQEGTMVA
ncbi:hypothetical protein D3C72_2424190 [compost metagenome]